MEGRLVKLFCVSVALSVLLGMHVFASEVNVDVTRKSYAESEIDQGYLLLELSPDEAGELFTYENEYIIPGDNAEGTINFRLNPGIMPVEIKLTIENQGGEEIFDAANITIKRENTVLYNKYSLDDINKISLGTYENDSRVAVNSLVYLELSVDKLSGINSLQNQTLKFKMSLEADMTDYVVIRTQGQGKVNIYKSLYNDRYYYPESGNPVLDSQYNLSGDEIIYLPDYEVSEGKDGIIGSKDDYYTDYDDGKEVYSGINMIFGDSDDVKNLNNGSGVQRGNHNDKSDEFGGGKAGNYQNDGRYIYGADKLCGTADDKFINKGRDGIYGTGDDYTDNLNGTNDRPGEDGIWYTEDDETWHNGNDGIPGNIDDRLLGYPNKEVTSGGSYSGSGGAGDSAVVQGSNGTYGSPVAFAKAVEGNWIKNALGQWTFEYNGDIVRSQWIYIYSRTLDQSDWYYFDASGVMQTGWQKSGSGKWYCLRTTNDARYGAMEKGLHYEPMDGKYYYLDKDNGIMRTGWIRIDDKEYYFTEASDGPGWLWDSRVGRWTYNILYGRPIGSMYVDERTPDGHLVNSKGARID